MKREIDKNLWTFDGPNVVFAGAPMNTRMTIARLTDGGLWVHSPIKWSDSVASFINALGGRVVALVAPNKLHYMFIDHWIAEYPEAVVFAEQDLRQKVTVLADAELLTDFAPQIYSQEFDQVVFRGNRLFQEVVFFHKESRTAIFTDLIVNLKVEGVPFFARLFLEFEGVTFPNGGLPRLYRWFSSDKEALRKALDVLVGWRPERALFCHGETFEISAAELIQREFAWLR